MNQHRKGNDRKRKREQERDKSGSASSLFLTSQDPGFEEHIRDHYQGFAHCPVNDLQPPDFHQTAKVSLERLRDANYYQYDVVMAGGKHSSRTFVKRCLVGNPGITYKYLGLRLFAHAWSGPGVTPLMKSIGEMNQKMIRMTKQFPNHKKCDYNLTLINYMEPTIRSTVGFKEEANYGMGKVSVSWHADSSLESGSSIGVYHCLPTQRSAKWDWRIALRPSQNDSKNDGNNPESAPAKPVVISTKDGDAYFLLGDFNENYQHCVLAGSQSNRISSTHRVAVTQEDTYDYILKRCKIARKRFRLQLETIGSTSGNGLDAKVIRYCQRVLTEVEMEWISQYWLQGGQHDKMHTWWQRPMKTLEAYWRALESATWELCHHICSSHNNSIVDSTKNETNTIPVDVIKVLVNEFKTRQSFRQQWDERRADKIYQRRIVEEYRPVARPIFGEGLDPNQQVDKGGRDRDQKQDEENYLPKDLTLIIRDLQMFLGKKRIDIPTKPQKSKKHSTAKSGPKKADSTDAISPNIDGKGKIKIVYKSRESVENDDAIEKTSSKSKKKKRKSKKKRKIKNL